MIINVVLFGRFRESAPSSDGTLTLDLPAGATVADVAARLATRDPRLADLLPYTRTAVNAEFSAPTAALAEGDEVAFLPPMSGG